MGLFTTGPDDPGERFRRCKKLTSFLNVGALTFDEFAFAVMLIMVEANDSELGRCIQEIPRSRLGQFVEYLRGYLEPVHFMPNPLPFLAGPYSEDEALRKKEEMKPKYELLYQKVSDAWEATRECSEGDEP